jgi:uncharacterized protein (TIGR02145 family)
MTVATLLFLSSPTQATESSSDLNLSVNSVVSLSITNCDASDASSVVLNIDPTNAGVFKSACQNISVAANTPGYSLSIKSSSTDLIYQNPTTLNPKPIVPSTTTGTITAPAVLPNDSWGFAIEDQLNFDTTYAIDNQANKYASLPTTDQTIYQTDKALGETPTPLSDFMAFYGAKLTLNTVAGEYKTTITYSAIGAEVPEPPPPAMQDFTASKCASMKVYTNSSDDDRLLTLTDVRNGQEYLVGKLADGNCWMLNNLRITPQDVANATQSDNNTGVNVAVLAGASESGAPDEQPSWKNLYGAGYGSDGSDITAEDNYGYLYSWCAATGGDPNTCVTYNTKPSDATTSICPANWRLPTGNYFPDGEFNQLNIAMFGDPSLTTSDNFYDYAHAVNWQSNGAFRSTYSFDALYHAGYAGEYIWSGTASGQTMGTADYLTFFVQIPLPDPDGANQIWFSDYEGWRSRQFAVRCLLK